MEAKDTVMSIDDLLISGIDFNKPLQVWVEQSFRRQAEISFKAGEEAGIIKGSVLGVRDITLLSKEELTTLNTKAKAYLQAVKQAGIREVVEWFRGELGDEYPFDTQLLDDKLKKWGIDNGRTK